MSIEELLTALHRLEANCYHIWMEHDCGNDFDSEVHTLSHEIKELAKQVEQQRFLYGVIKTHPILDQPSLGRDKGKGSKR